MGVNPRETKRLPIKSVLNIPNFNEDDHSRGFLRDELLQHLSFRVANLANYNENEETLIEHINKGSSEPFSKLLIPHS